ncbi:Uncharacterised protein [Mycobacterium tuberculosis]|uniref:Uncharacterized protein n=1 Tax=Mycobacterium tuberculosis TaxID=1773 RepID=A0A916LEI9_MYCTX|nr:Uncharacterised protein [Mycobacterium tuberculosis]COY24228.1 Uncharacterised protein [Mycobacterium tuberculosis]COZ80963.1 Uncharacterised protein [Mycobacterium tuberculosis]
MLPPACLGVNFFPRQPDDIDEEPFGEAVLAHHGDGQRAALFGELQVAIASHPK